MRIDVIPPQGAWSVRNAGGPLLATAIHAGHSLRPELRPYLAIDEAAQRREEDPLTGVWAEVSQNMFCSHRSRFEIDLNRPRELAFAIDPAQTWGLRVWRERPPAQFIEQSLKQHDIFYTLMRGWIESLIREHGTVLVLDIHSYNHRRGGEFSDPAPPSENPDIDLLDRTRFGTVAERLAETLARHPAQSRTLDVRMNVRYPDGGYFPEWVFSEYGDDVCTISLEYKKFYMDEWTGAVWLPVVDDLYAGLREASSAAVAELVRCR